jgi:hypothetical protein
MFTHCVDGMWKKNTRITPNSSSHDIFYGNSLYDWSDFIDTKYVCLFFFFCIFLICESARTCIIFYY